MSENYVLNEAGEPVVCDDLFAWALWFEDSGTQRVVAKTKVGDATVSTVFLGLNHAFNPSLPPVLWETMVFGGPHDAEQDRCSGKRRDALMMHEAMVKRLQD